jgi:hypothetical protein
MDRTFLTSVQYSAAIKKSAVTQYLVRQQEHVHQSDSPNELMNVSPH